MPGLAELVARELARRQEGDGKYPCFAYSIDDADDALTDVKAARAAIIATAGKHEGREPTISRSIADAVGAALRAAYPRRFIMTRSIVESPHRLAARPETEGYHAETDAAVVRAAARLAKLREMPGRVPRASQPDMQQDSRDT
jgi:hypothetical protein